ncbi:phospholipase-like protein, partial [Tanacetum coccineum]
FKEERILEEESRLILEKEARLMREEEKLLEDEKFFEKDYKKCEFALMNSDHIKQAMARMVPKKRSHCTCVTSFSWLKVSSKFKDKAQGRCDLSRCNTSIDNVWLSEDLDLYLGQTGLLRCRFTWCNDRMVNRKFWESLVCLDPPRKGWLLDDHIDLWVEYMWHVRPKSADWAMVSSYFVQLLLQDSMPNWYANGQTYNLPWSAVDQVLIPLNEPSEHWSLAKFDICSGLVTFYDSGDVYAIECRYWYIKTRDCLQSLLHFRIVSKTWKSIIDSTYFVVSYGARPRQPASFLVSYD